MDSKSVISNQIQFIVSQICGRCGHLVEEISNLYEEEIRKLRDDLWEANKVIGGLRESGFGERETPVEVENEYDCIPNEIEQIQVPTFNMKMENEQESIDIIDIKVEPSPTDMEHSEDEFYLSRQMRPTDVSKTFPCKETNCSLQYLSQTALNLHVKRIHSGQRQFECNEPDCNRAFPSAAELKKHMQRHERQQPLSHLQPTTIYECIICKLTFENEIKLQGHLQLFSMKQYLIDLNWTKEIKDHHPNAVECGTLFCHEVGCRKAYLTIGQLRSHTNAHSRGLIDGKTNVQNFESIKTDERALKCPQCSKTFTRKGNLENHRRKHLIDNQNIGKLAGYIRARKTDRPFLCSHCGKGYMQQYMLKRHMNSHTGERPFSCHYEGCGKSYYTQSSLYAHKFAHEAGRRYPCTWPGCKSGWNSVGELQKHVRIHTGEKPYKCHYEGCNMSFAVSTTRSRHIKVVHLNQRRFECSSCGRTFGTSANLKAHLKTHQK